jgi:hypothetical protein
MRKQPKVAPGHGAAEKDETGGLKRGTLFAEIIGSFDLSNGN